MNKWNDVRAFYRWADPFIAAERSDEWAIDPYEWSIDGIIELTPIERWLWHDIRAVDLVLYPQYPVGRFFVDFANPVAKVAIECDGAAYHTDTAKDATRDAWMRERGWSVYRISGRDCRDGVDSEHESTSAARAFVEKLAMLHSICRSNRPQTRGELLNAGDLFEQVKQVFARGSWRDHR